MTRVKQAFVFTFSLLMLGLWLRTTGQPDSVIHEARTLMMRDPAAARLFLENQLNAIENRGRTGDVVPLLHQLAIVSLIQGDRAQYSQLNRAALKQAMRSGDPILIANCQTKLSTDYRKSGSADSAAISCLEAIRLYQSVSADGNAWTCYLNLGALALDDNRPGEAEHYFQKALATVRLLEDPKSELIVIGMLQNFYLPAQRPAEYAQILEQFLKDHPEFLGDTADASAHFTGLLNLGGPNAETLDNLRESIRLYARLGHTSSLLAALARMGSLLMDQDLVWSALDTFHVALALAVSDAPVRMRLYYLISQAQGRLQNYAAALDAYRRYTSLKDSLLSESTNTALLDLKVRYETSEKELLLDRQKEQTQLRTVQRNVLFIIFTAVIVVAFLGFLYLRNRLKLHRVLADQRISKLEQEKQLVALSSVIEGQEVERKRISRDLHDGLGGLLTTIKARLGLVELRLPELADHEAFQSSRTLIDRTSQEVRRIAYDMMPASLQKIGLGATIEDLCSTLQQDHGLEIDLQVFGLEGRLKESAEVVIYRIIQELCNNIVRHAHAQEVFIQMNFTPRELFLVIEDNGVGFDPRSSQPGLGLANVRSRVHFLNGTFDIDSGAQGTCVTIVIPGSSLTDDPSLSSKTTL